MSPGMPMILLQMILFGFTGDFKETNSPRVKLYGASRCEMMLSIAISPEVSNVGSMDGPSV